MKSFGLYFFEMTFAWKHFHVQELKEYNFGTFLKNTIYSVLDMLGCKATNWKAAEKRI